MELSKLPVPGGPTIWITVGQGPNALAVGTGGGLRGVTQGKDKKWLLKTGDPLIHLHYILVQGTKKRWLLKIGDPLIEVTT